MPIGQRIADERHQPAILLVVGGVAFAALQVLHVGLLGGDEGIDQRFRDVRMLLQHLGLHHHRAVDRIDAGALEPVGFGLRHVRDQFRIDLGRLLPPCSQAPVGGPARPMPAWPVKPACSSPLAIMPASDFPSGAWTTFGGSFSVGHVLLVVDHPGDLGGVEAVFVDEDAARPHAGGDRIGAHADLLAFQVLRHLDAGIGPARRSRRGGSAASGTPAARCTARRARARSCRWSAPSRRRRTRGRAPCAGTRR